MIKILFVCHGNICRSPMAEFVMKDLVQKAGREDFLICSAATSTEEIGNDIHYGTRNILHKYHIPYERREAIQITAADYHAYDWIIGMDHYNVTNIKRRLGEDAERKIRLLLEFTGENRDVADPWYTGDFETTYRDVCKGCKALMDFLSNQE